MITYDKFVLDNGLTLVAHRDTASRMAAVNVLYKVGARNESPERTGFAHLFEHLMFRGTANVPDFDAPVQMACGENNAFTNNDYTDYYITLPTANIETALWLESDRMQGLNITPQALSAEKKVVIEEFNQRYLNQPYGDQWMLLRALAYKVHPYRWATIGITPEHISGATLHDVRAFYTAHYNPSNAILSIAADMDFEQIKQLAQKWFGDIPAVKTDKCVLPKEPRQLHAQREQVVRNLPASMITIAFKMDDRRSDEFYVCDIISDLLAGGNSARLYQSLVKRQRLFSSVNAYITGDINPGLFVVTGQLLPSVTIEQGEQALWDELEVLKNEPASDYEMEKVKNKFEAGVIFGELNVMNKAMNLGFYEMLGDLSLINREVDIFRSIDAGQVVEVSKKVFTPSTSSTLIYKAEDENR